MATRAEKIAEGADKDRLVRSQSSATDEHELTQI